MRILFVAARELSYARNEVLLRALRRFATVDAIAPERAPVSLLLSSAEMVRRADAALRSIRYDLIVAGFYGYLIAQALTRRSRTPLLFDAFVSNYDTLVDDRGTLAPNSAGARIARWLDQSTCARADRILLDTQAHADYFAASLGVEAGKIDVLPVGCSEDLFAPSPLPPVQGPLRVLYYCTWLPLHGGDVVVRAASLLGDLPMEFRLVGDGPLRAAAETEAAALGLESVRFLPPMAPSAIAREVAAAHICLGGHYGPGAKAQRTIPGKLYQMIASRRPVIGAESVANRELLVDGTSALLVPAQDQVALAEALRRLHDAPALREGIAAGGRAAYEALASEAVITERLNAIVEATLRRGAASSRRGAARRGR
jgi:glycosyltransferase involved in cell wall biosynthesis